MIDVRIPVIEVLDDTIGQERTHNQQLMEGVSKQAAIGDVAVFTGRRLNAYRDKVVVIEFFTILLKMEIGKLSHHLPDGVFLVA